MAYEYPPITVLIPDLRDGDKASWDALIHLFSPALIGKAATLLRGSKLQRQYAPEDLVNVTFAKAWDHHASMRGQSTFQVAKWLLTIMLNTYRDLCRRNRLPEESQKSWAVPSDIAHAAGDANEVEALEEEVKLHAKIAELDADDREVIVLKFWHQLTHQQIADRRGTSKASITRQVHRIIPQLNKAMRE